MLLLMYPRVISTVIIGTAVIINKINIFFLVIFLNNIQGFKSAQIFIKSLNDSIISQEKSVSCPEFRV